MVEGWAIGPLIHRKLTKCRISQALGVGVWEGGLREFVNRVGAFSE